MVLSGMGLGMVEERERVVEYRGREEIIIIRGCILHGKVQMFLLAIQASRLDLGIASSPALGRSGRLAATAAGAAIVATNH